MNPKIGDIIFCRHLYAYCDSIGVIIAIDMDLPYPILVWFSHRARVGMFEVSEIEVIS